MDYILVNIKWWDGFCKENTARTIIKRHNERKLHKSTYQKVFAFHGFKKHTVWAR